MTTPVLAEPAADKAAPTSYAELVEVLGHVGLLLREARRARGLSVRGAAKQIGVSFATVSRIESGEDAALSSATRVLSWLDLTPRAREIIAEYEEATHA